jgi:hypothetical protein
LTINFHLSILAVNQPTEARAIFVITIQGVEGGERPAQNARAESRTPTPGVPETVKK